MLEFTLWRVSGKKLKLELQLAGGTPALPGWQKPLRNCFLPPFLGFVLILIVIVDGSR
jgi:hypothetical protein